VAPFYVVAVESPDSPGRHHPVRRVIPPLDDGSHRSYAIQWFSFALIALGGAAAVVAREQRARGQRPSLVG
jgi:surfeit locus 1 family protein